MIEYAEDLCLTPKTERRVDKIKKYIETRTGMIGTVIIALSSNEKDVFDLIPCFMFKTKVYSKLDLFVVGIAENNSAAYSMIEDLIQEYLDSGSDLSMRQYFFNKFRK